jgi:hypothetical protein
MLHMISMLHMIRDISILHVPSISILHIDIVIIIIMRYVSPGCWVHGDGISSTTSVGFTTFVKIPTTTIMITTTVPAALSEFC